MKLPRATRIFAAIVMLFSMLFTQLAVAAYACPQLNVAKVVSASNADSMPGCTERMDGGSPALCNAHCDTGHQSLDTPAAPTVQPFAACQLALVLPRLNLDVSSIASPPASLPLTRITSPPFAIRHCCFRI